MVSLSKRRTRRLRKKLHLAEFQELGFEVAIDLSCSSDSNEAEHFIDAFLKEAIEPRSLCYGGWLEGFIAHEHRGSATAEDQRAVEAWLERRKDVVSFRVGPLVDAWHTSFDEKR